MPVTKPTTLPEWATEAPTSGMGDATSAAVVAPNTAKQKNGWGDGENPPAQTFQWLALHTYRALEWLFDVWAETAPGGAISTARDVTVGGTLGVTGSATFAGVSATNLSATNVDVIGSLGVEGDVGILGALEVDGATTLGGGATVNPGQTLTLTGANVAGGTYTGQTLTSPAINGGTINAPTLTGTVTATGATVNGGTLSGTTITGAVTADAATFTKVKTSGAFEFSTARTLHKRVHAVDLVLVSGTATLTGGMAFSEWSGTTNYTLVARVDLPLGASITGLEAEVENGSATAGRIWLRIGPADSTFPIVEDTDIAIPGSYDGFVPLGTTVPANTVTDNSLLCVSIQTYNGALTGSLVQVVGIRVTYTTSIMDVAQ